MTTMKRIRQPKRITVTKPNLPQYEGTEHTIIGNRILFVTAMTDPDCGNPLEDCDGMGSIRSLSRRHINNIPWEEAKGLLDTDPDVIPLSYFEHGNSLWMVMDDPAPAGVEFQWDGVKFAGIWIPDKCVRESYDGQDGLTRRDWMKQQAANACQEYTAWSNGDCWGYHVEVFKVRKDDDGNVFDARSDYRRDEPEFDESCHGLIGREYLDREMKDLAVYGLKALYSEQGYGKRAIAAAFKGEMSEGRSD